MKVYFTTSQRGKGYFDQYYIRIYNEIKRLGHTHLDDEIVKITSKEFYKELKEGGKEVIKLYKNNLKYYIYLILIFLKYLFIVFQ